MAFSKRTQAISCFDDGINSNIYAAVLLHHLSDYLFICSTNIDQDPTLCKSNFTFIFSDDLAFRN